MPRSAPIGPPPPNTCAWSTAQDLFVYVPLLILQAIYQYWSSSCFEKMLSLGRALQARLSGLAEGGLLPVQDPAVLPKGADHEDPAAHSAAQHVAVVGVHEVVEVSLPHHPTTPPPHLPRL